MCPNVHISMYLFMIMHAYICMWLTLAMYAHLYIYVYVTEHEKTGFMYTKYISLYYGTYLLYCLRY